jgi:hypothetical protein
MHMKLHNAYQIDGKPILGLFRIRTLEDLHMAHDTGFNLAASSHPDLLDVATPMGRFALENGIKSMYPITGQAHSSPRLAVDINAGIETIPYEFGTPPDPGPGTVIIEEETIRYAKSDGARLIGCERGAEGTQASAHRGGITMFWPEPLAADIERVKNSPNLWGYWALDDTPGDVRSLMRALTKVVHDVDGLHPVAAGFNSPDAMVNFGPGGCDVMVLYWYPALSWGYDRQMTPLDTQAILATARKIEPEIPFIGIYQGFWGGEWNKPCPLTPFELHEQAEDFVREGAAGLMTWANLKDPIATGAHTYYGFNDDPEMVRTIRELNEEVRATGGLEVRAERPDMAAVRMRAIGLQGEEPEIPGVPPAWHIAYPFDAGESPGLGCLLPPDEQIDLAATYSGKNGVDVTWNHVNTNTGTVADFGCHKPSVRGNNTVIFALCYVSSPAKQDVQIRLGCSKDTLVRVNGREVLKYVGGRGVHMDENIAYATLPEGKSEILVKLFNKSSGWGFTLRLADVDGRPLEGVTFSPTA